MINVTQASRFVIDRGISLFREYLGMYAECKRTNNWYGYNGETGAPNDLLLPSYLIQKTIRRDSLCNTLFINHQTVMAK